MPGAQLLHSLTARLRKYQRGGARHGGALYTTAVHGAGACRLSRKSEQHCTGTSRYTSAIQSQIFHTERFSIQKESGAQEREETSL